MEAPTPAPNRLPPEVSPVFLGDTIKNTSSPNVPGFSWELQTWCSALPTGHLPPVCAPHQESTGRIFHHTPLCSHPHLAKICFSCRFFPWVTVGSHQPPNCSTRASLRSFTRKHSLNLYSVPCSELGPRGKDMPQCRLQILTGQWKPHRTSADHTPGEEMVHQKAITEAIRASDLTHRIGKDLLMIPDLSHERRERGREVPSRQRSLPEKIEKRTQCVWKPLADWCC